MNIDLMLEAIQAQRDADARRLQEGKRVRTLLAGGRRAARGHRASGVLHGIAHAFAVGHARVLHEHAVG